VLGYYGQCICLAALPLLICTGSTQGSVEIYHRLFVVPKTKPLTAGKGHLATAKRAGQFLPNIGEFYIELYSSSFVPLSRVIASSVKRRISPSGRWLVNPS
jgi:hypothetical protein